MLVKCFCLLLFLQQPTAQPTLSIDFGQSKMGRDWQVILDGVMGGRSQGDALLKENSLYLKGKVSLENNGGFVSLKGPFKSIDLSSFKTLKIRLKSTGIAFAVTLETDRAFYRPYFKQAIQVESNDWEIISLDINDFLKYRMGRFNNDQITVDDLKRVLRIGFISNEKKAGNFEFEVDYIEIR